jgi:hypothetical protein
MQLRWNACHALGNVFHNLRALPCAPQGVRALCKAVTECKVRMDRSGPLYNVRRMARSDSGSVGFGEFAFSVAMRGAKQEERRGRGDSVMQLCDVFGQFATSHDVHLSLRRTSR